MGWGVHDYPEPLREREPVECIQCHEPLGEDGGWYFFGGWNCKECTKEYIQDNFTTEELASALDIEHKNTEDIYDE